MNWAVIDAGTYDYAADAWGYTYGAAAEWYQGAWTLRGGVFDISTVPNGTDLDTTFSQFQLDGEIERRTHCESRRQNCLNRLSYPRQIGNVPGCDSAGASNWGASRHCCSPAVP